MGEGASEREDDSSLEAHLRRAHQALLKAREEEAAARAAWMEGMNATEAQRGTRKLAKLRRAHEGKQETMELEQQFYNHLCLGAPRRLLRLIEQPSTVQFLVSLLLDRGRLCHDHGKPKEKVFKRTSLQPVLSMPLAPLYSSVRGVRLIIFARHCQQRVFPLERSVEEVFGTFHLLFPSPEDDLNECIVVTLREVKNEDVVLFLERSRVAGLITLEDMFNDSMDTALPVQPLHMIELQDGGEYMVVSFPFGWRSKDIAMGLWQSTPIEGKRRSARERIAETFQASGPPADARCCGPKAGGIVASTRCLTNGSFENCLGTHDVLQCQHWQRRPRPGKQFIRQRLVWLSCKSPPSRSVWGSNGLRHVAVKYSL